MCFPVKEKDVYRRRLAKYETINVVTAAETPYEHSLQDAKADKVAPILSAFIINIVQSRLSLVLNTKTKTTPRTFTPKKQKANLLQRSLLQLHHQPCSSQWILNEKG
jgi:hypothetical protein